MTASSVQQAGDESEKRRVVFVDDDPLVLRSIKRLMKRRLATWDLVFAESGEDALARMRDVPVDVIVSDLNMGRMDGAALLQRVQQETPDVVRVVLSGSTSREEACLTTRVAHQFLAKPFDSDALSETLQRAAAMRSLLDDSVLRALVGGDNTLPAVPRLYVELTEVLRREDASLADVAMLIEQEPAIAARMMQVTSSAFLGRRMPPRTVRDAVVFLGVTVVKSLVLTHRVVTKFSADVPGFSAEDVQMHGLRTAALASEILSNTPHMEQAFLVGMLHVIGRMVLAARAPKRYAKVLQAAQDEQLSLPAAERAAFGATHAEVAGFLLGLWGLPHSIVDAVVHCHRASSYGDEPLGLGAAVYFATRLVADPDVAIGACGDEQDGIDDGLVERLGVGDSLPSWRFAARSLVG